MVKYDGRLEIEGGDEGMRLVVVRLMGRKVVVGICHGGHWKPVPLLFLALCQCYQFSTCKQDSSIKIEQEKHI